MLCIARPELLEARPSLGRVHALDLEQLSDRETSELVEALGVDGRRGAPQRIAATAEGNPLFAEQLAAMVPSGDARPRRSSCRRRSTRCSPPASTASSLPSARMLERASVVGKEFWQRALVDLSPRADQPHVDRACCSRSSARGS